MAQEKNLRRRKRQGFLDALQLDEPFLRRAERKLGRPALISGSDEDGNPILIKMWPKTAGQDDGDLREIWQHEVRQLHRLGGYPGASKTIATLKNATVDDHGFYLVLDLGQRRPLDALLGHSPPGHWLKNLRLQANRAHFWRNVRQVAAGLEILHSQGLLHRNLDRWSILTSGGTEPDFQLTGFEWSLRLSGAVTTGLSAWKSGPTEGSTSFVEDWHSLGVLCAELLGVDLKRLLNLRLVPSEVSEHLTADETRLLRQLVRAERLDRLDGEFVERRIQDIVRSLEADLAGKAAKFFLVLRLGAESPLTQRIRDETDGDIESDDVDDQVDFVRGDLSDTPLLLAVQSAGGAFRLVLRGLRLNYALEPYAPRRDQSAPSWEMAYSDGTESEPAAVNLLGQIPLPATSLEVITIRDAAKRFPNLRGKLSNWDILRSELGATVTKPDRLRRTHQALALTQFIEALFAAADAFPAEILQGGEGAADDDQISIQITIREDPARDALSSALGMKPPAKRFEDALTDERRSPEWVLTDARHVGGREATDTVWRYSHKVTRAGKSPRYVFTGQELPAGLTNPTLIPGDHVGRDVQLRRRFRALRALSDHSELLRMLDDPRARILESHEPIPPTAALERLDESKRQAMTSIIGTVPLFLVQGPPGVGKTRLVREIVENVFSADASSRLLLTAQSNSAVNHLMDEIDKSLGQKRSEIVIVRSQSKESKEDAGPYEVSRQTQSLVEKLAASAMAANAPPRFREALRLLRASPPASDDYESGSAPKERSALEALLVRGANVVFATTNSHELERLIDDRGQFDWVMIEEAGKATGGELVAPLLLSYRRLMIGDHKQLPPFGSDAMKQLLSAPLAVGNALKIGEEFVGRTLRDPSTDEVLDEIDSEQGDLPALCALALDHVMLFERIIEKEYEVQRSKPRARRIGQRLTLQHRMHPAIAEMVSHAFYDDELKTHEDAAKRFATTRAPIVSVDEKKLPNAPIVFVEMDWVQTTIDKKDGELRPRWHNPDEVVAATKVISLLRAAKDAQEPPTLALLSPYSEQVKRLRAAVDDNRSAFPDLSSIKPAVATNSYCGTVDSFQGNEADAVIVSLVRNNHRSSARSGLGFLSDYRRMNVLLSRAQWRLVILGSTEFLRSVLKSASGADGGADVEFLGRFLNNLEEQRKAGNAVIIPATRLDGGKR